MTIQMMRFDDLDWSPHPDRAGIDTRLFRPDAAHNPTDALIARVAPQSEIPWHVHSDDHEFGYILSGVAMLHQATDLEGTTAEDFEVQPGDGFLIHKGTPHALTNTGNIPVLILALHLPA